MRFKCETLRFSLIIWMYLVAVGHFVAGILMAWFSSSSLFDHYHQTVLAQFSLPESAMQQWWSSLFGATLQNLSVFMAVLIYVGNKYRNPLVWLWMMAALVIWAPQDILISLQVDLWMHVWVDVVALFVMLPPLLWLWWIDKS